MKRLIGTLFLCLVTLNSFAQGSQTVQDPLDTLYDGGANSYSTVLRQALVMPRSLIGSKKGGFVIFEITVKSTAEVSAKVMTKFNDDTEKSVLRGIQATVGGWITADDDYTVYQPILFNHTLSDQSSIAKKLNNFPEAFKYPLLPLISVTPNGIIRTSTANEVSTQSLVQNSTKRGKKTNSNFSKKANEIEDMKAQVEKHLANGKSKKAYALVNNILGLNPFDKSLIQQRRRLEKELGKDEYRVYDILWLQALDQIKQTQSNKP